MQNIDYLLKNEFSTFWLNFIVFIMIALMNTIILPYSYLYKIENIYFIFFSSSCFYLVDDIISQTQIKKENGII